MTVAPKVAIVILHWRGLTDTLECLESLKRIHYINWELVLVLNGASDSDRERIAQQTPTRSHIVRLEHNRGFAAGCNAGMAAAISELDPDYILLLNNDTIVDQSFLDNLVTRAESDHGIGVVGAKTYYYGQQTLQFTIGDISMYRGRTFNRGSGQEDHGQFDVPRAADYVHGACLLVRTSLIEAVGLFDEQFFAYWEETDLCLRLREKGFRVAYEPLAVVWHKVSRSSSSAQVLYYLLRNNIYFMRKHARWYHWVTFLPYFVCRTTPLQAARPLLRHPLHAGRAIATAYRDGFRMDRSSR